MLHPPPPGEALVAAPSPVVKKRPAPRAYVPTLGPVLRVLLAVVFGTFAVLGATGAYLLAVTVLNKVYPDRLFTTPFTFWTLLGHTGVGTLATIPFVAFGVWHGLTARRRPNKVAVIRGLVVFALGLVVVGTGFALVQLDGLPQLPTGGIGRNVVYFLHVMIPGLAVVAYVAHRKAGPKIQYKYAKVWAVGVTGVVALLAGAHFLDPRTVNRVGSADGVKYFEPSLARTATGKFIPANALMMDDYCMKCHPGVYDDHLHSAHKFSSFNNPAYLFERPNETRKVSHGEASAQVNVERGGAPGATTRRAVPERRVRRPDTSTT